MRQKNRYKKKKKSPLATVVNGQRFPAVMHILVDEIKHIFAVIQQSSGSQVSFDAAHADVVGPLRKARKFDCAQL